MMLIKSDKTITLIFALVISTIATLLVFNEMYAELSFFCFMLFIGFAYIASDTIYQFRKHEESQINIHRCKLREGKKV